MPKAKNSDRAQLIMAKYLVLVSAYVKHSNSNIGTGLLKKIQATKWAFKFFSLHCTAINLCVRVLKMSQPSLTAHLHHHPLTAINLVIAQVRYTVFSKKAQRE